VAKGNIVVGADVGTSKVAICVGALSDSDTPEIIGFGTHSNSGMRRGLVVDIDEVVTAISGAIEDAERTSGSEIKGAFVNVNGPYVAVLESKGVIAVGRADGEVAQADVDRAIDAARAVSVPRNQEILGVIPKDYTLDGEGGIKDPVGMTGVRLEATVLIIAASPAPLRTLERALRQAGLEPLQYILSPLASARPLLSRNVKESGVCLLDFGASTTQIAVYEEGSLIHAKIIPLGSMHLTNDLAIGLRTTLEVAEKVKTKFASAEPKEYRESEVVRLSEISPEEEGKVPKKYIAQILDARLDEIFGAVQAELRRIGRDGKLPAGVALTGGGSKLSGIVEYTKERLKLPGKLAEPIGEIGGMVDRLDNPRNSAAVGLMLSALEAGRPAARGPISLPSVDVGNISEKAKNFFKQFLP
jgi:cell division protein FtsA